MAGPAGLAVESVPSPGCNEMRVVLGVQFCAPRQVSRTNTWRTPLFGVFKLDLLARARAEDEAWLGVTATKATNRPDALTEGKIASVPTKEPFGSAEIRCVVGVQAALTPKQVSRK